MSTPIQTITDALIAFIMSLLHDPAAQKDFNEDPQGMMYRQGVGDACLADVRSVVPVIVEHHSVIPHPTPPGPPSPNPVIREITRILNQFTTIDNRTTLVDQSTNQNIWTEGGDVMQHFDQTANVASGDGSMAAGHDINHVDSTTTVTAGDISVGNTSGSYNSTDDHSATGSSTSVDNTGTSDDAATVAPTDGGGDASLAGGVVAATDAVHDATQTAVDTATDTTHDAAQTAVDDSSHAAPAPEPEHDSAPAPEPEPADHGYDISEPLTSAAPDDYPVDDDAGGDQ